MILFYDFYIIHHLNYHYHCYYENENGGDEEYIDEERENDIEYYVEPFDYNNEEHMNILREQENEFWKV